MVGRAHQSILMPTNPPDVPAAPTTVEAEPHPALRPYVVRYVESAFDLVSGAQARMRISAIPGPLVAVTWAGAAQLAVPGSAGGVSVPSLSFGAPLSRWADLICDATHRSFSVQLRAVGTRGLLGVAAGGLLDRAVPLDALVDGKDGRAVRAWQDALVHAEDFAARVRLTDEFLLRRAALELRRDVAVAGAVALIERTAGRVRTGELTAAVGLSERTLRRRFADEVGLRPKRYARVVRFRRAAAFLRAAGAGAWPDAVLRFGYVDQAHLVHEFRELGGTTPAHLGADGRWLDLALLDAPTA
jgi:AraC-like DNA-binding protein